MAHALIIGTTESGKTTLAKQLVSQYRQRGLLSLVFDPVGHQGWMEAGAHFETDDIDEFMALAVQSRSCALFIDESGEVAGQHDKERFWLATRARHQGHSSHFLAQRANMLSPNIRTNCSKLFLFTSPLEDCKTLSKEFVKPELMDGAYLAKGEFFYAPRFAPTRRMHLWSGQAPVEYQQNQIPTRELGNSEEKPAEEV